MSQLEGSHSDFYTGHGIDFVIFQFSTFFVSLNKITESANLSHDLIKVQCANMPMVKTQSRILIFGYSVYGNRYRMQPSSLKLNARLRLQTTIFFSLIRP